MAGVDLTPEEVSWLLYCARREVRRLDTSIVSLTAKYGADARSLPSLRQKQRINGAAIARLEAARAAG